MDNLLKAHSWISLLNLDLRRLDHRLPALRFRHVAWSQRSKCARPTLGLTFDFVVATDIDHSRRDAECRRYRSARRPLATRLRAYAPLAIPRPRNEWLRLHLQNVDTRAVCVCRP